MSAPHVHHSAPVLTSHLQRTGKLAARRRPSAVFGKLLVLPGLLVLVLSRLGIGRLVSAVCWGGESHAVLL